MSLLVQAREPSTLLVGCYDLAHGSACLAKLRTLPARPRIAQRILALCCQPSPRKPRLRKAPSSAATAHDVPELLAPEPAADPEVADAVDGSLRGGSTAFPPPCPHGLAPCSNRPTAAARPATCAHAARTAGRGGERVVSANAPTPPLCTGAETSSGVGETTCDPRKLA